MSCEERDGWIHYHGERSHRGAASAALTGRYRPAGEAFSPQPGTLEHFLTERYCLYASAAEGQIIRGEIHHPPWRLQIAEANWERNTMTTRLRIEPAPQQPLLHFARRQDVRVWPPRRLSVL